MACITALGFDFGLSRIGIAVGQSITQTATPVQILKVKNGEPNWSYVTSLVYSWSPDVLVVGLPLDGKSCSYDLTFKVQAFGNTLENLTKKEVVFVDEILTTKTAKQLLSEKERPFHLKTRSKSQKNERKKVDSFAACLIVEDYLKHLHQNQTIFKA